MKVFIWLLLVSMSAQDTNRRKKDVLQCEPRNVTVKQIFTDQMLLLTWQDDPFCSRIQDVLIYEVAVILTDNFQQVLHHDVITVKRNQTELTHSWNWTSPLAFECASYSVRLSSQFNNLTSQWRHERTPGKAFSQVFPKDRVLEVGRNFTFCCILGSGEKFSEMKITGYDAHELTTTKVSDGVYAVTAHLRNPSPFSCTNVLCGSGNKYGACVYVGYPPSDMNLVCETQDLESVECHWKEGRDTYLSGKRSTVYRLLGRQCDSPCQIKTKMCGCRQNVQVTFGEMKNWTITAQNELGMVELTDTADLAERVHMYPPQNVIVSSVNSRNACLEWQWLTQHYNNLPIVCQTKLHHNENIKIRNDTAVGLRYTVLHDLIPNQEYTVQVRCAAKQFWKWSHWGESTFQTKGDIPEALDVWMMMEKKQTVIMWKALLANQSNGQILDYEVTWRKTNEKERQKMIIFPPNNSAALSLNISEEHVITVTARNLNGSSTPSALSIPRLYSDRETKPSEVIGRHGGFDLSWSASPAATCGYTVDWCATFSQCTMEWLKVPRDKTNARILSDNFKDGVRYSLSIYACTRGAPELLQKREGYVRERKKLIQLKKWEQLSTDVKVSWAAIPPQNQSAFVRGYIMYYTEGSSHGKARNVTLNVTTGDPEACTITARDLRISSYTFTVKALTSAGDGGDISFTLTMNPSSDNIITVVTVSLILACIFLSLGTILCYRKWTCIRQKIYPPIPKPVLTEDWVTLLRSNGLRILHVDPCLHNEVDVSELYCKLEPVDGEIGQKKGLHYIKETPLPLGYYHPATNSSIATPLAVTTHTISPPSMLPPLPFWDVFENPLYNVVMPHSSVRAHFSPGPPNFYHVPSVRNSDYQPQ